MIKNLKVKFKPKTLLKNSNFLVSVTTVRYGYDIRNFRNRVIILISISFSAITTKMA